MTIHVIGDSTAASKLDSKRPEAGWAEYLYKYLNPDQDIKINNQAINGRSSRSYKEEGHFDKILPDIKAGDYVFMQFGHNDSKTDNGGFRYTDPFTTYQAHLKYYCEEVIKKGAIPVILSSIPRRRFIGHHRLHRFATQQYPFSAKCFAKRENILFIDAYKHVKTLLEYLGKEDSKYLFLHLAPNVEPNYPQGVIDDTHLNTFGARMIAGVIAKQILQQPTPLADFIVSKSLYELVDVKRLIKKYEKN